MRKGFTLIELMIVVAIIGILAAVAIPKFAELIRKSKEGQLKGNLGQVRSALSIYYGDNEGNFPQAVKQNGSSVLSDALVPRYLSSLPSVRVPNYHAQSSQVYAHESPDAHNHELGYWMYDSIQPPDSDWGRLWIGCNHTDTKGSSWKSY